MMKKMKNYSGLFGVALAVLFSIQVSADEVIERVLADKKFEVVENPTLSIDHKFGTVTCRNWNENAISVKVTASVKTGNTETAEKIIDKIEVRVKGDKYGVTVESDFNDKLFNSKKHEISIDIEIMMPENLRFKLDNQFGNSYIESVSGETDISSEYGSIEIKALKGETNSVEIGFGEARINYINKAEVEVAYSSFTIDEAESLSVESSYSNFKITGKVNELDIENEGGSVEINEVNDVVLDSKFSEFKIGNMLNSMNGDTQYGSLKVGNIFSGFSEITINNSFGSVNLEFESNVAFYIEASMEFCSLEMPESKANFSERKIGVNESSYKGTVGGKAGTSKVKIDSSFGGVRIDL